MALVKCKGSLAPNKGVRTPEKKPMAAPSPPPSRQQEKSLSPSPLDKGPRNAFLSVRRRAVVDSMAASNDDADEADADA